MKHITNINLLVDNLSVSSLRPPLLLDDSNLRIYDPNQLNKIYYFEKSVISVYIRYITTRWCPETSTINAEYLNSLIDPIIINCVDPDLEK